MLRAVARPRQWQKPWVCSTCLSRAAAPTRVPPRRLFTTSPKPAALPGPSYPTFIPATQAPQRKDDYVLRSIFDRPDFWRDFSTIPGSYHVGLFRNAYLKTPDGFISFAQVSLRRARAIVVKVMAAATVAEYRLIVRQLDQLSDVLCRVLDMADFVRAAHPSRTMQSRASECWEMLYQYMNELNTMTGLHDQLARAMADPKVTMVWSEEEKAVADVLRLEFTKSAVNLPQKARDRFVQLSSEISTVGSEFVQETEPDQPTLVLPSNDLLGMDPTHARKLTRGSKVYLPTMSGEASMALRSVHSADARKLIYYASRTASQKSVEKLEYLMKLRAELARLSGFESYGHLALRDRMMAKSPAAVDKFLRAVAQTNRPRVQQELADMLKEKRNVDPSAKTVEPWDKEYYSELVRRPLQNTARRPAGDLLMPYLSLGSVMQGLSRLFTDLYGIRFVPRQPLTGETWHPDVRRIDVMSDEEGHVAILYCDLFHREDKLPNPAHFTLRCSREIDETEMADVWDLSQREPSMAGLFRNPASAANDGMAYSKHGSRIKQLPTIALICDFPDPARDGSDQPALLSFYELETLFHEMGHAIHSILARTSFQTVSGTRCATDLAELPSTLMEYFASDPGVVHSFARHYQTDEPVPLGILKNKILQARRFEGSETENQIILSMLDQALHTTPSAGGNLPGDIDPTDSTAVYHHIQATVGCCPPDPRGTRWQGFFGHLYGYGSTYYSYLFDRVLAQRVWEVVFQSGHRRAVVTREKGERLRQGLLKWGGGRDPWRCLADVLQDERLAGGGEEAMALVGSWWSVRS
ncbi:uncharacterized protein C8A04DRAFT_35777 [Dichotomopilus funicola]|uniref:Mitochondrial intermediate peptidase n=1 Tax=Dichotomopilus funicola TaxID=1934379 RepID=A0AAN6V691_9PEZI|nr:hypothetical protein C8A04DRAFT_35777 [Dichotomopilus funicola]